MALGKNVLNKPDKLIKRTTGLASNKSKTSNVSIIGQPSKSKGADTYGTVKMTFYIKADLYEKIKNFAFWDRHTLTEAFNLVVEDGLKGKNAKPKGV